MVHAALLEDDGDEDDDEMDVEGDERERAPSRAGRKLKGKGREVKGKGREGDGGGEVIDAFGTLSISQHGVARFFGPTGGSEVRSSFLFLSACDRVA